MYIYLFSFVLKRGSIYIMVVDSDTYYQTLSLQIGLVLLILEAIFKWLYRIKKWRVKSKCCSVSYNADSEDSPLKLPKP
jgi:hypothetical protein